MINATDKVSMIHEMEIMEKKIENLKKIVGLLKKLYFYGDTKIWKTHACFDLGKQKCFIDNKDTYWTDKHNQYGGKLARKIESAVKKIEEEV